MKLDLTDVQLAYATLLLENKAKAYVEANQRCDNGFATILREHQQEWPDCEIRLNVEDGKATLEWDDKPEEE
jgi:hypothetical protein